MKIFVLQAGLIAVLLSASTLAFAQGQLNPPGAPAPTLKTLQQVEPRIPIDTLPGDGTATHIISIPGSYYLTGNLGGNTAKHGIRVDAVGVTIDLNGHMLEGVVNSSVGIFITASGGPVTIRNGNLRFWSNGGIVSLSNARVNVEDLDIASTSVGPAVFLGNSCSAMRVRVNGTQRYGIRLGIDSLARHCLVENFSATNWTFVTPDAVAAGIKADTVVECTVRGFSLGGGQSDGAYGISGKIVENCLVETMNFQGMNGAGIISQIARGNHVIDISSPGASEFAFIMASLAEHNHLVASGADSTGIEANGYKARIHGNVLVRNKIRVFGNSEVTDNRVQVGSTNTAIQVAGAGNRIVGNAVEVANTSFGIHLTGPGNFVQDNSLHIGSSSKGINVEGAANLIRNNNIRQGANSVGIEIDTGGAHNRIDENMVTGGASGIIIFGGVGATNNLVTRNFVADISNNYYIIGSGSQSSGVLLSDTIAATNSTAWINFGQP